MSQDESNDVHSLISKWAKGETTLKEIKGYTDDELYAIAHQGYFFLMQGKNQQARTIFEGLVAIDPRNDYYYRALGVIYHKLGDTARAIRQFSYAIRVAPRNVAAYVNRAEVYVATGMRREAVLDLRFVVAAAPAGNSAVLLRKARALLRLLS
jgi:Flp pilus assembly protein TadD